MTYRDTVISNPKALPGDDVSVQNYRMRPAMWEHGECIAAEYKIRGRRSSVGYWTYTVILNRHSESGRPIRLYVGDNRIALDED